MRISDLSDRKSSTIIQEKYDSGRRKHGLSKRVRKQTAEKGAKDAVIEGDQRERYKSAIPESSFWQTLSKLNFRIWKKGAQCLRIPQLAPSLFMSATYGPPEPLSIYNRNLFARRVGQLEERLVFSRLLPRFSRNRGNCLGSTNAHEEKK